MKQLCYVMIVATCYACTPGQADTQADVQALDSVIVETDTVAIDSAELQAEMDEEGHDEDVTEIDPDQITGTLSADGEYTITNQGIYPSDPFGFSLDTTAVRELLPDATFKYTEYPGGKDEYGGEYSGFTYFEVFSDKTTLSFYSYSGKHHADIYTPDLMMSRQIHVGMTKETFIENMALNGTDPNNAKVFTISDDYGSVSFHFDGDILQRIYVYYEEGD
jgi:hypothetical protein